MKTAVRPVSRSGHVAMLNRIEVDVVNVPLEIGIIANGMFPIAPLPNTLLSFADLARRSRSRTHATRETTLDQIPPHREIGIVLRKCPDRMDMVGQNADRDCFKGTADLNGAIDLPQMIDLIQQQAARPVGENDREKESA